MSRDHTRKTSSLSFFLFSFFSPPLVIELLSGHVSVNCGHTPRISDTRALSPAACWDSALQLLGVADCLFPPLCFFVHPATVMHLRA